MIMITGKTRVILVTVIYIIAGMALSLGNGLVIGEREYQNDINLELGLWTPDTKIEQTFIASMNNLSRIDFRLDSYHPWDSPYLDCRLFEIDTEENPFKLRYEFIREHSREVRSKRLNGWMLSGHMFNSFSVTPLLQSKNKRYLFSIQSPGLKKGGTSILLASPTDRYLYFGNLFVNGERKEGDLAFRALYKQPRLELICKIVQRLALQKPFIFSTPAVYYILFISYLFFLGLLFYWFLALTG